MRVVIEEALTISTELNSKIWDKDHNLKPEIREGILNIVEEFKNEIEDNGLPLYIADVRLLGSQASYNYTDHSDLDVHIVSNFSLVDASQEILQSAYNAMKANFNKNYDISIKGINVELYVEDINTVTISNGIYSVLSDAWVKFPTKLNPELMKKDISPEEAQVWIDNISFALSKGDINEIESIINALYLRRKDGLATEDKEFSKGNILFKHIRDLGLLDDLKDARIKLKSKELSLESIQANKVDFPEYIYLTTFEEYLEDIETYGLGSKDNRKMMGQIENAYDDPIFDGDGFFFAIDPDEALAYTMDDERGTPVLLRIPTSVLNKDKIYYDSNNETMQSYLDGEDVENNYSSNMATYFYAGVIKNIQDVAEIID